MKNEIDGEFVFNFKIVCFVCTIVCEERKVSNAGYASAQTLFIGIPVDTFKYEWNVYLRFLLIHNVFINTN